MKSSFKYFFLFRYAHYKNEHRTHKVCYRCWSYRCALLGPPGRGVKSKIWVLGDDLMNLLCWERGTATFSSVVMGSLSLTPLSAHVWLKSSLYDATKVCIYRKFVSRRKKKKSMKNRCCVWAKLSSEKFPRCFFFFLQRPRRWEKKKFFFSSLFCLQLHLLDMNWTVTRYHLHLYSKKK